MFHDQSLIKWKMSKKKDFNARGGVFVDPLPLLTYFKHRRDDQYACTDTKLEMGHLENEVYVGTYMYIEIKTHETYSNQNWTCRGIY